MIELLGLTGILGGLFIFIAWIPETLETIKRKRCNLNPGFQVIYLVAAFLLVAYSWHINDLIFIVINIGAAGMALINIYYESRERGIRRFFG